MKTLALSADLQLPLDAVTQTFAILARRGAGKTYAAGKLCEEMSCAMTVTGGTFLQYLRTLIRNGLADVSGDDVRAGSALFVAGNA